MSNPSTPTKTSVSKLKSKSKSKSKSRPRKRRGSGTSSLISIDPVSLKNLRAVHAKVQKENKKQKALYLQQKKSKFQDYTNKYIATELKEDDEYNKTYDGDFHPTKAPTKGYDTYYESPVSRDSPETQMEDITVEELLPLIKNLVDRHNKLQEEYDNLNREFREQRIVFEDKITELEHEQIDIPFEANDYDVSERRSFSDSKQQQMVSVKNMRREYEDKMEHLKNNYENNMLSIQARYAHDIDTQKKEISALHKELNDADKQNLALRQTLDALEHDNQSLRISMNNSNKQFHDIKLYQNKNKALLLENETLKEQVETLEQEMDIMIQEQEEQEEEMKQNDYLNQNTTGTFANPNQRPQTPTHAYTRTVVMGTRDALEVGSNKGLSDHDSSMGNDLLHQIGDEIDIMTNNQSSIDPPDRDSEDQASVEYDDDEKKINDDNGSRNTIAKLSKFKKIGMDPDSMAQIMALLQEKEKKRLHDNFSVESNYSDSQQKLEEQIDGIEDDIRELKDMVLSLMDSTNNIQPSINANLGPIIRKINRMYVMLSGPIGPLESRTSDANGSVGPYRRRGNIDPYDPEPLSERSLNTKSSGDPYTESWIAFLSPYVNDWMPSIGFSAIILSTMYLLIKYHRGRFIGIGQPRVLRNKRKK